MKYSINWKLFFILLIASVIASLLILPYELTLSSALARVFTPVILVEQLIQTIIEFSFAIFIGLYLAKRVGFGLPVLEDWLEGKEIKGYLKSILGISIGLGVLAGIVIILLNFSHTDADGASFLGPMLMASSIAGAFHRPSAALPGGWRPSNRPWTRGYSPLNDG